MEDVRVDPLVAFYSRQVVSKLDFAAKLAELRLLLLHHDTFKRELHNNHEVGAVLTYKEGQASKKVAKENLEENYPGTRFPGDRSLARMVIGVDERSGQKVVLKGDTECQNWTAILTEENYHNYFRFYLRAAVRLLLAEMEDPDADPYTWALEDVITKVTAIIGDRATVKVQKKGQRCSESYKYSFNADVFKLLIPGRNPVDFLPRGTSLVVFDPMAQNRGGPTNPEPRARGPPPNDSNNASFEEERSFDGRQRRRPHHQHGQSSRFDEE